MNLFIMSTTTEEHNYIHLAQYRPNSFKIYIALIIGKQSQTLKYKFQLFMIECVDNKKMSKSKKTLLPCTVF